KTPAEIESAWPAWVSQHDAKIRARLERGDDDSIVNLLLFGVTFTTQPRTKTSDILTLAAQARTSEILQGRIVQGRVEDMVGSIRRVAIVGPGLDFTDKLEGYDFYPQQTFQPFGVIDSLIRLGLASRGNLRLTTFDLNLKINQHLDAARQRARAGGAYVLQLP